ncbi:MAG: hypothetical protein LBQ79_01405 [Deltaproteobacteria bacterium]|nr:hypothetical protein [Deltaproteobacteria bacterium]
MDPFPASVVIGQSWFTDFSSLGAAAAAVPSDHTLVKKAKSAFLYALNITKSDCRIKLVEDAKAVIALSFSVRQMLGESDVPGWEDAAPWLLRAEFMIGTKLSWQSPEQMFAGLLGVPGGVLYQADLVEALARAASFILDIRQGAEEADRYLARAFAVVGSCRFATPSALLSVVMRRAEFPGDVDYGPGAPLPGRAGALRNALDIAVMLNDPDLAAILPGRFLFSSKLFGITARDLRTAAEGVALPQSPIFRLYWETLEAELDFRERRGRGPFSAVRAPEAADPAAPFADDAPETAVAYGYRGSSEDKGDAGSEDAELALETAWKAVALLRRVSSETGLRGLGPPHPLRMAAYVCSIVLGRLLSGMDLDVADALMGIIGPARASGEMAPECFDGITVQFLVRSFPDFAGVLMRAASAGLLGSGGGLVQAIAIAAFRGRKGGSILSDHPDEARDMILAAGRQGAPSGLKIASLMIELEHCAKFEEEPDRHFAALVSIWEEHAGKDGGTEDGGAEGGWGTLAEDPAWLSLYAFAAGLAFASHICRGGQGASGGDAPERDFSGGEPAGSGNARVRHRGGALRVARIARLARLLPNRARMTRGFLSKLIPSVVFLVSLRESLESGRKLAEALAGEWGGPHLNEFEAFNFWLYSPAAVNSGEGGFRAWLRGASRILAAELSPWLRTRIVTCAVAGFGCLKLPEQMEDFLLDHFTMLVSPNREFSIDWEGRETDCGDPSRNLSLPGPRGLSLDRLLPMPEDSGQDVGDRPDRAGSVSGSGGLRNGAGAAGKAAMPLLSGDEKARIIAKLNASAPAPSGNFLEDARVRVEMLGRMLENCVPGKYAAAGSPDAAGSAGGGAPAVGGSSGGGIGKSTRGTVRSSAPEREESLPPKFSEWLASGHKESRANLTGNAAHGSRRWPGDRGEDSGEGSGVRSGRNVGMAAGAAGESPTGKDGIGMEAAESVLRKEKGNAPLGVIPSAGGAPSAEGMADAGMSGAPREVRPGGWLEWMGEDGRPEARASAAKMPDAAAPDAVRDWEMMTVVQIGPEPLTALAECLARCGRYHKSLDYMRRDEFGTVFTPARRFALYKVVEGLARSGAASRAAPALRMLEFISKLNKDPSIVQDARKVLASAPKGGGGSRKKAGTAARGGKRGGRKR